MSSVRCAKEVYKEYCGGSTSGLKEENSNNWLKILLNAHVKVRGNQSH